MKQKSITYELLATLETIMQKKNEKKKLGLGVGGL